MRRVFAFCVLLLIPLNLSAGKHKFDLVFASDEWRDIGKFGYADDLLVLDSGEKLWGHVQSIPELHYSFANIPFKIDEVAALSFDGAERMQVVTRHGENYIAHITDSQLRFRERIRRPIEERLRARYYDEISIPIHEINFIFCRSRGGAYREAGPDVLSFILKNGDRIPGKLVDRSILFSEGRHEFALPVKDIVDLRVRDGVQGLIRTEAADRKLAKVTPKHPQLRVALTKKSQMFKLHWDHIDRIVGDMGQFEVSTPYLMSKWTPEDMSYVPPGRYLVEQKRGSAAVAALRNLGQLRRGRSNKAQGDPLLPTAHTPQASIQMHGFFADRHEVTNEEYARFVAATGHRAPPHWVEGRIPKGLENHPVVYVSHADAEAYAAWAGKRLPTELEWERMAKGANGCAYPYGNRFDATLGNVGSSGTRPVGSFAAAVATRQAGDVFSGGALSDLSGNVAEWTSTPFHYDKYWSILKSRQGVAPYKQLPPSFRVTRGGSFRSSSETATTTYRVSMHMDDMNEYTGFRCVADVRPDDLYYER